MAHITTVQKVKEYGDIAGSSDDVLLDRLVKAASDYIETWCSRKFDVANYVELLNGNGQQAIAVSNFPVVTVNSVIVDGQAIPAFAGWPTSGWRVDGNAILLNGPNYRFTRGSGNVAIDYTAGYTVIPEDLQQAAIELVLQRYRDRSRTALQSQALGGQSVTFNPNSLSPFARATLMQYKRVTP